MVQYILTPWRDRQELLLVRRQLYASSASASQISSNISSSRSSSIPERSAPPDTESSSEDRSRWRAQHQAVARVSMWMQRGNCPHMVESTALLTAAMLSDEDAAGSENAASSTYAIRAAYAAAFSRFVTGLLDGHQDKQRKQSMYSIAKTIGLPATFVELRHQSTHEQLPSLAKLRSAAKMALAWIWDYYWKHLGDDGGPLDPCKDALLRYLREEDKIREQLLRRNLDLWPKEKLITTIDELRDSLSGEKARRKCAELSRQWKGDDQDMTESDPMVTEGDTEKTISGTETAACELKQETKGVEPVAKLPSEDDIGWSYYQGDWKTKPIGVIE